MANIKRGMSLAPLALGICLYVGISRAQTAETKKPLRAPIRAATVREWLQPFSAPPGLP